MYNKNNSKFFRFGKNIDHSHKNILETGEM